MKPILISLPSDTGGPHGRRAWSLASHLMTHCPCELLVDGAIPRPVPEYRGAVVFDSEHDSRTLRLLHHQGVPAAYCPPLGPVSAGFFVEEELFWYEHILRTRLKMQMAAVVLVDSWAKAEAAEGHYGIPCAWLPLPGGGAGVRSRPGADLHWREPTEDGRGGAMLWVVEPAHRWSAQVMAWTNARRDAGLPSYRMAQCTWEQAAGMARDGDLIFLPNAECHPDTALSLIATGAVLLTPESGAMDSWPAALVTVPSAEFGGVAAQGPALDAALDAAADLHPGAPAVPPSWAEWSHAVVRSLTALVPLTAPERRGRSPQGGE